MKKVLIAIDYSPTSQYVAEYGFNLGKALNAEMIILHVVESVLYYSSTSYDPIMGFGGFVNTNFLGQNALDGVLQEATLFLEKTKYHLKDDNLKTIVEQGPIPETILEVAQANQCDLIVIGTHGRNGIEEFLLGSTAHKLLKNATIPLYILPYKLLVHAE